MLTGVFSIFLHFSFSPFFYVKSSMGNEYITTFIGLQSLGYPSLEPCGSVIPEQEDVLLNASMMYAHGVSK